mmetsp:Transcript_6326/g.14344  ORF Transcript_6326/g.14344 Transcript_6326/m.14344 type:complete len:246 (-) Transcript_6326:25-762(-)
MDPPLQLPRARAARGARGAPERGASRSRQTAMKQAYTGGPYRGGMERSRSAGALVGSQKCLACGKHACRCAQKSMQMARKTSELLAHRLLCWRCSFCSGAVEGFEDEPLTVMPLGHSGAAVSEDFAQHLSRWLAKLMTEDRYELGQMRAQQREQRNQEAFEAWKQRKDMEARSKVEDGKASPKWGRGLERQRPSREQCEEHYEAWCRRYDERSRVVRVPRVPGSCAVPRDVAVSRDRYVPVTFES